MFRVGVSLRSVWSSVIKMKRFNQKLQFVRLKAETPFKFRSLSFKINIFRVLRSSILISSSLAGACLYVFLQKKHLCVDDNCENDEFQKFVDPDYAHVIAFCRDLLQRLKDEVGTPGLVVGVSVDGEVKWEEGLGYADIENRVPCTRDTVMRIASISKSITMAAVAKLWEEGKLDFDKPVQYYVPDFPKKTFNGQSVDITCRQLVSHLAGIRHYSKGSSKEELTNSENVSKNSKQQTKPNVKSDGNTKSVSEFDFEEYYIKDKFTDVKSSLQLFKDDALVAKPGSSFNYSTHGWTLISAIVEKASNEIFTAHMQKLFKDLGMLHTYLDVNDALIYYRSRNYVKDKRGCLVNAPYVDNSYKWAGGGFLSTVGDLLKFANAMLYSLQFQNTDIVKESLPNSSHESTGTSQENENVIQKSDLSQEICSSIDALAKSSQLQGYLQPKTMKTMWYPVTKIKEKEWSYGMGWFVLPNQQNCEYCQLKRFSVAHTGGAIGASSVLLIMPSKCSLKSALECETGSPPKGIVVTITTNLMSVSMLKVAYEIAENFHCHHSKASSK